MTIPSYSYPVSYGRNKNISTSNIPEPVRANIGYMCIHRPSVCPVCFVPDTTQPSPAIWQ